MAHGAVAGRDLDVVVEDRAGRGGGGERGVVGTGDDDVERFIGLEDGVADDGDRERLHGLAGLEEDVGVHR